MYEKERTRLGVVRFCSASFRRLSGRVVKRTDVLNFQLLAGILERDGSEWLWCFGPHATSK